MPKNESTVIITDISPMHESIRFYVHLMFVSPDHQDGISVEFATHAPDRNAAIVEAITANLDQKFALCGISVYQCIFTA